MQCAALLVSRKHARLRYSKLDIVAHARQACACGAKWQRVITLWTINMSKTHGFSKLKNSLVDVGASLGKAIREDVSDARKDVKTLASGYTSSLSSRANKRANNLQNTVRQSASNLRSRMERHADQAGSLASTDGVRNLLAHGLKRAAEKLEHKASLQAVPPENLSDPHASGTGLRVPLKTGPKNTLAVQQHSPADPSATKPEQDQAHERSESKAVMAERLAQYTAWMSSDDELVAFKTNLLDLPREERTRPLFALALNSWSYSLALRTTARETFQELRGDVPDDNSGRLAKLSMDPQSTDVDRDGAEAWQLASSDERNVIAQAFELNQDTGRGEVEIRVAQSMAREDIMAFSQDAASLANALDFETKAGQDALKARLQVPG
jgi:hypothetical protein